MTGFEFMKLELQGAFMITNFSMSDHRGEFTKYFEKDIYEKAGISFSLNETFVSISAQNVIRGLHFQLNKPQAKLVCAVKGKVWDVVVDLRPDSLTYKKWTGVELSADLHNALYIPKGFAHGFLSLENDTIMLYQCEGAYDSKTDTGIRYDDPEIGIQWPIDEKDAVHSERDLLLMSFAEYEERPMML